jgi:NADH:ubiquinone oxidoreductase subunit 5 (subunit L)/multisubunit Na+/H+ antiporter MnhA subunit
MVFRGRYMAAEKYYSRFILLVISFIVRIFLLILSPNLISILLG